MIIILLIWVSLTSFIAGSYFGAFAQRHVDKAMKDSRKRYIERVFGIKE